MGWHSRQIVKRNDHFFVLSRGEELITEKFPEYELIQNSLPNGVVMDGEIIPQSMENLLPFSLLQTRIGRKNITKILQDVPICFFVMIYLN